MNRLPFRLPDFTRVIWNSEEARAVWEPRISAISRAWMEIEREAVARGVRPGALLFVPLDELPKVTTWAFGRGLAALPIALEGASTLSYASSSSQYVPGQPGRYRFALCKPEAVAAWAGANDESIGRLLGYPDCCAAFFQRVWVQEQKIDTTWDMARGGTEGPPECNILLRWLGVRMVPHLPCGFNCEATYDFARRLAPLWHELGYSTEYVWASEMLSWPVEWTGLHGIAEVRTPVCTVATRTDATEQKEVVAKQGTHYPDEGALGLKFPYRIVKDKATGVPSFKRSMATIAELNGFNSEEAMNAAHADVLSVLPDAPKGRLLDLGCGTGRLLEKAKELGWDVHGVEIDNVRAGAGRLAIRRGSMFDLNTWPGEYDVVLVMPGRLSENGNKDECDRFRQALRERAKRVLFYAYGDWRKDGLLNLVRRTFGEEWADQLWRDRVGHGAEAAITAPATVAA